MKINKERLKKLSEIASKYTPIMLCPGALAVSIFDVAYGPRISQLKLEGYSDEEILYMLNNGEA